MPRIKLKVQDGQNVTLGVQDDNLHLGVGDSVQIMQSGDYNDLTNRPQINGVTLTGNKTTEDLGIEAGVSSWNGQTGDVVYEPPEYEFAYDESVSVGYAEVGTAVTGVPNYTPSGTIELAESSVNALRSVSLTGRYSNYALTLGLISTTRDIPVISEASFNGAGVKVVIKEKE